MKTYLMGLLANPVIKSAFYVSVEFFLETVSTAIAQTIIQQRKAKGFLATNSFKPKDKDDVQLCN